MSSLSVSKQTWVDVPSGPPDDAGYDENHEKESKDADEDDEPVRRRFLLFKRYYKQI